MTKIRHIFITSNAVMKISKQYHRSNQLRLLYYVLDLGHNQQSEREKRIELLHFGGAVCLRFIRI